MVGLLRRTDQFIRRHPHAAALTVLCTIAAVIRLAFLYRVPVILTGDSQSHYLPGFDLVFGNEFEPELRRPPGYAFFVAGTILVLGEELRSLAFAQHLLGVSMVAMTYALGVMTFGRVAGFLGGLLVALNGALLLSGQSVMTETLFTVTLLATMLALLLAGRSGHWAWALAAGVILGAASLTRPVAQALVILVPLAFLVYTRRPLAVVRGTLLVAVGVALVLGPWMLRNLAEHGTLSAAGGLGRSLVARTIKYDERFFDESRPAADGDFKAEVRQFIRGKRNTIRNSRSVRSTQAGLMKEFGLSQAESDRIMRQVATEAILEHPGYYTVGSLRMAWQIVLGKEKEDAYSDRWVMRAGKDWDEQWEPRVHHLLGPSTPTEQASVETAQWLTSIFQPATVGAILPILAALGIILAVVVPALRPALVPGLMLLGILLASAALDGPVPRYRYPLDPFIALFAAGAVTGAAYGLVTLRRRLGQPAGESGQRSQPTPARGRPAAEASR